MGGTALCTINLCHFGCLPTLYDSCVLRLHNHYYTDHFILCVCCPAMRLLLLPRFVHNSEFHFMCMTCLAKEDIEICGSTTVGKLLHAVAVYSVH